ncbi:S-formylglutathione hydrolase FrmB [Tamaricihabitans halophyticus]|uniref:S-formylglutathione hydrolase FrmB n=1 Tax=Tamaricihabitans halophyticus TaxID=1262583 RepID=A0A4V6NR80_9PSEU|nr:alpha/beta hydrolase-fold protein [Tamaricihabitans halophyticus]TCP48566.1 S-formylglutathione hydrolase FrmB [Tamaricihabitans halophyticus]
MPSSDNTDSTEQGDESHRHAVLGRRRYLAIAGSAVLAATGFAVTALEEFRFGHQRLSATIGAPQRIGMTVREQVYSAARGRTVNLVTHLPDRDPPEQLPVALVLHGLNGRAAATGLPELGDQLRAQVSKPGQQPFALVAVDGGNHYWHEQPDGDDPLAMLLDELPGWLRERGLGLREDGMPEMCLGTSMGGFGALLYGRRRVERGSPLGAIAVVAPALLTSWREMRKREAFRSRREWASLDPLRHPRATGTTPLGVWCGDRDRFIEGARRFITTVEPEVADIRPGGHTGPYFSSVVPDTLAFLGRHCGGQTVETDPSSVTDSLGTTSRSLERESPD